MKRLDSVIPLSLWGWGEAAITPTAEKPGDGWAITGAYPLAARHTAQLPEFEEVGCK
ncbi:MAG: hypothetical protein M3O09_03940 [Acidobacteriota bacterium]|jgi:hypothetical protein|nr:hypothetical protein [Acidobacteriota bacterium]